MARMPNQSTYRPQHGNRSNMYEDSNAKHLQLKTQTHSLISQNQDLHQLRTWEDFFGKPQYAIPRDPANRYERENYDLPDAFKGRRPHVEELLIQLIKKEEMWPITELAPLVKWETGLDITWDRWEFNQHRLGRTPEEGVSRLLTSKFDTDTATMVRYGIALQLEHGFMKTERGRQNYAANLQQIKNAAVETMCFGVMVTVYNPDISRLPMTNRVDELSNMNELERVLDMMNEQFGCVVKDRLALQRQLDDCDKVLKRSSLRKPGNYTIVPEGTKTLIDSQPWNSFHFLRGDDNSSRFERMRDGNVTVRTSEPFHTGDGADKRELSVQRRQTGNFGIVTDKHLRGIPPEYYRTIMMAASVYSEQKDDWHVIGYDEAIAKSGIFYNLLNDTGSAGGPDKNDDLDDAPLSRGLGVPFFEGARSWGAYLEGCNRLDTFANAIWKLSDDDFALFIMQFMPRIGDVNAYDASNDALSQHSREDISESLSQSNAARMPFIGGTAFMNFLAYLSSTRERAVAGSSVQAPPSSFGSSLLSSIGFSSTPSSSAQPSAPGAAGTWAEFLTSLGGQQEVQKNRVRLWLLMATQATVDPRAFLADKTPDTSTLFANSAKAVDIGFTLFGGLLDDSERKKQRITALGTATSTGDIAVFSIGAPKIMWAGDCAAATSSAAGKVNGYKLTADTPVPLLQSMFPFIREAVDSERVGFLVLPLKVSWSATATNMAALEAVSDWKSLEPKPSSMTKEQKVTFDTSLALAVIVAFVADIVGITAASSTGDAQRKAVVTSFVKAVGKMVSDSKSAAQQSGGIFKIAVDRLSDPTNSFHRAHGLDSNTSAIARLSLIVTAMFEQYYEFAVPMVVRTLRAVANRAALSPQLEADISVIVGSYTPTTTLTFAERSLESLRTLITTFKDFVQLLEYLADKDSQGQAQQAFATTAHGGFTPGFFERQEAKRRQKLRSSAGSEAYVMSQFQEDALSDADALFASFTEINKLFPDALRAIYRKHVRHPQLVDSDHGALGADTNLRMSRNDYQRVMALLETLYRLNMSQADRELNNAERQLQQAEAPRRIYALLMEIYYGHMCAISRSIHNHPDVKASLAGNLDVNHFVSAASQNLLYALNSTGNMLMQLMDALDHSYLTLMPQLPTRAYDAFITKHIMQTSSKTRPGGLHGMADYYRSSATYRDIRDDRAAAVQQELKGAAISEAWPELEYEGNGKPTDASRDNLKAATKAAETDTLVRLKGELARLAAELGASEALASTTSLAAALVRSLSSAEVHSVTTSSIIRATWSAVLVRQLLCLMPINGRFVRFGIEHNLPPLFFWSWWRPHGTWLMGTIAHTRGYGEVLRSFYGHTDFQLSDNIMQKMHFGHFTMYEKTVEMVPGAIAYVQDAVPCGYLFGNGHLIWDPLNPEHMDDYANGEIDRDIFIIPIPLGEYPEGQYADVTGFWSRELAPRLRSNKPFTSKQPIWAAHWGMEHDENPITRPFFSHDMQPRSNTICSQGAQRLFRHTGNGNGDLDLVVVSKDCWGDRVYRGCKAVRSGLKGYLEPVSSSGGGVGVAIIT